MINTMPLAKYKIIAFATIVDVERAKHFYRDTLGLKLVSEEPPFALVFDANGIMIRLGMAKELPKAHGTVLGWQVPQMKIAARDLTACGIQFERFEGLKQDEERNLGFANRRKSSVVSRPRTEISEASPNIRKPRSHSSRQPAISTLLRTHSAWASGQQSIRPITSGKPTSHYRFLQTTDRISV